MKEFLGWMIVLWVIGCIGQAINPQPNKPKRDWTGLWFKVANKFIK